MDSAVAVRIARFEAGELVMVVFLGSRSRVLNLEISLGITEANFFVIGGFMFIG